MTYKPECIINDKLLYGFDQSFNPNHFFFEINCFLKEYKLGDFTAGNIIQSWAYQTNINQRMIMVTLQREQSLLAKKNINEIKNHTIPVKDGDGNIYEYEINPLDWATGCGVPDYQKPNPQYEGFFNQIKWACKTYQRWFILWKSGDAIQTLDNVLVKPENAATYALYKYTPWVKSGKLTYDVYSRYFNEFF